MRRVNSTRARFKKVLSSRWRVVELLDDQAARGFFESYIQEFVRSEFEKKFWADFNGVRHIGPRYFHKLELVPNTMSLCDLLKLRRVPTRCDIRVMWGGPEFPVAFRIQGDVNKRTCLQDLFIQEGDAIAEISASGKVISLFLEDSHGDLFKVYRGRDSCF